MIKFIIIFLNYRNLYKYIENVIIKVLVKGVFGYIMGFMFK